MVSRTKLGFIGGLEPLKFAVQHLRNLVLFSIENKEGSRIAIEIWRDNAAFFSLIGQRLEPRLAMLDGEFEVNGKLFVSDSPVGASCGETLERWEGNYVPIRFQLEEQPRRVILSGRDPDARTGFVLKLTEGARGALFAAISPTTPANIARCHLEGDLEVTQ